MLSRNVLHGSKLLARACKHANIGQTFIESILRPKKLNTLVKTRETKSFDYFFLLFCGFRTNIHAFCGSQVLIALCRWLQNCESSIVVSRCMNWFFQTRLHCATIDNLWHYKIMYHLQEPRLYVKSWWMFCPQLSLVLFWTKVMNIGCLWMCCNLSYQLVETFGKS